ncbi:uncharacterized protein LTR77_010057 [Saxophila tyrrhenica]|uniref:Uncharacterized protein n=1 Tax=Saxophila tyrrhenica TaxID=1690608 RepID=A0AAV9NWT3_9PEZI|nr:hypothetical protein LTR77_010057 [Saxophila tyrrhenica]
MSPSPLEGEEDDHNISLEDLLRDPQHWDDSIYSQLEQDATPPPEAFGPYQTQTSRERAEQLRLSRADLSPSGSTVLNVQSCNHFEIPSSARVAVNMLTSSCSTLTSICLDWIMTAPSDRQEEITVEYPEWLKMYLDFFRLRFPRLKALQFRNNCDPDTRQPEGLYLLDRSQAKRPNVQSASETDTARADFSGLDTVCLDFMEAHTGLQCLAWPMDTFFSANGPSADVAPGIDAIIDRLSQSLLDLRVDAMFRLRGTPATDSHQCPDAAASARRRQFIEKFASRMTKLESIKIEGGVPRDERRETVRALHACPLKKIVMIGVSSQLGNTWGARGRDLGEHISSFDARDLEVEDKDTVFALGSKDPCTPPPDFDFEPSYGWSGSAPMLQTLASYHRNTVTELKFCGYSGAAILFQPTPITTPFLASLKHFHNLESLIISTWLSTTFEGARRDDEVIRFWIDSRSPSSTAIARFNPTDDDEEEGSWAKELRTKFAPDALARRARSFIGPFLSENVKTRKGGCHVRISICIGEAGGIFDMDMRVGSGRDGEDVCLGYEGPREELEEGRRRAKLENRRWF